MEYESTMYPSKWRSQVLNLSYWNRSSHPHFKSTNMSIISSIDSSVISYDGQSKKLESFLIIWTLCCTSGDVWTQPQYWKARSYKCHRHPDDKWSNDYNIVLWNPFWKKRLYHHEDSWKCSQEHYYEDVVNNFNVISVYPSSSPKEDVGENIVPIHTKWRKVKKCVKWLFSCFM